MLGQQVAAPALTRKEKNMPYDNYGNFIPPYNQQPYPIRPQQNVYAFVNGLEGAKSYQVPANQTVLLMDSEQPVCYMKTANALGQGTLRYFKLTEVNEADVRTNVTVKEQNSFSLDKNEDFVTLRKRVDEIEKKLGDKNE